MSGELFVRRVLLRSNEAKDLDRGIDKTSPLYQEIPSSFSFLHPLSSTGPELRHTPSLAQSRARGQSIARLQRANPHPRMLALRTFRDKPPFWFS